MEIDENNKYWQRIPSYLLNNLIIFNEVFRRVMTNENIKSRQKTGFQPLFRRYIFQKSTSGWEWNWLPLNWNPIVLRWNTHKITCSCMNLISNQQETIKLLREGFERLKDQIIGMNMKQKVTIKIRQTNFDIYSNQILVELIKDLF